jgi:hypothetical protein
VSAAKDAAAAEVDECYGGSWDDFYSDDARWQQEQPGRGALPGAAVVSTSVTAAVDAAAFAQWSEEALS